MEQSRDELLKLLRTRLLQASEIMSFLMEPEVISNDTEPVRTQRERVLNVLRERSEQWLTVAEIASLAGITQAAARMILYSDRDAFVSKKLSARRVVWRIASRRSHVQSPDRLGVRSEDALLPV